MSERKPALLVDYARYGILSAEKAQYAGADET
jgi:hypothetical protein